MVTLFLSSGGQLEFPDGDRVNCAEDAEEDDPYVFGVYCKGEGRAWFRQDAIIGYAIDAEWRIATSL
jgi:hypothetical protein